MATRRVASTGRWRLAFILIGFLAISGVIILRRSLGIRTARELTQLDTRRSALVAERLKLESEIRAASSRARLQPIAEQRLQMHVPADSQVILVPRTHETP